MIPNAASWIRRLKLRRHPEGGYYRETYRAKDTVPAKALPRRFAGQRCFSTAIYFLLRGHDISRLHRLQSDELWHFYAGGALTIHIITPPGQHKLIKLGKNPKRGESFQVVIPSGGWFGAAVNNPRAYSLVGCTVAPGFDFADFEPGNCRQLLAQYPQHAKIIRRLTA